MDRDSAFVPILNYHGLSKGKPSSANGALYTLEEAQFQSQMAYLADHRHAVVSLEAVRRWFSGEPVPKKPVVITFDDGLASDDLIALPILKRYGFTATFFVNPGTLDTENHLTAEGVKRLSDAGMEIGSHGFDHIFLTRLDEGKLDDQLIRSKKRLEGILKKEISFFSIPRGRYNRRILTAIQEAGYRLALTSDVGGNTPKADPFRLRRWALKGSYTLDDFISIVEGRPKRHLRMEHLLKRSAYGLLGHALYERLRGVVLKGDR